jgi:hypothetical protein
MQSSGYLIGLAEPSRLPTVPGALIDKPEPKPKARALSGLAQIQDD